MHQRETSHESSRTPVSPKMKWVSPEVLPLHLGLTESSGPGFTEYTGVSGCKAHVTNVNSVCGS